MRSRLSLILLITVASVAAASDALRQIHELGAMVVSSGAACLWDSLPTVHANGRESCPMKSVDDKGESQDQFRWQGQVSPGQAIEIKGINGGIRAESASGNQIEVVADKTGRRSDPGSVRVQVIEHTGGVTICALYPSDDPGRPNVCEPGPGSHMRVRDNDVRVEFTVRVPVGVRFIGRTVNGGIDAQSVGSDVEAYTVNGGIHISAAGFAQARTVNGSITASLRTASGTSPLEFTTVNGGITLDLPAETNLELQADTLNGDIFTDFPLTVQGRFSHKHISGTIGSGGRQVTLKTVNGGIRLRRSA
jgi:hypothetical protein